MNSIIQIRRIESIASKLYFTFFLLLALFCLNSCCEWTDSCDGDSEVEPSIFGCTEINACNYETHATENDGSCYYCTDCSGTTIENSNENKGNLYFNYIENQYTYYLGANTFDVEVRWAQYEYCQSIDNIHYTTWKNNLNHPISFNYYIESNTGNSVRNTSGSIYLNRNQTLVIEEPDNSFYNINNYPATIYISNLIYHF